jgi:hypothetical protein
LDTGGNWISSGDWGRINANMPRRNEKTSLRLGVNAIKKNSLAKFVDLLEFSV